MDCQSVSNNLTAFQDGFMVEAERRLVTHHLGVCAQCSSRLAELNLVASTLRELPTLAVPAQLAASLRVDASRVAAWRCRYAGVRGLLRLAGERTALLAENLMRPLALPFAGGLSSAVLLFLMVFSSFHGIVLVHPDDVPTVLATGATIKGSLLPSEGPDEIVLDVLVNEEGRGVDYRVPAGFTKLPSAAARRQVDAALLFLRFQPATTFGQPTTAWVRVSFHRSYIDVRG